MSYRTHQLQQPDVFDKEKSNEQKFHESIAELIITDFVEIAIQNVEQKGPGILVVNLQNDSTTFVSGADVEKDILIFESESKPDADALKLLRDVSRKINANDWSKNVIVTLITHDKADNYLLPVR